MASGGMGGADDLARMAVSTGRSITKVASEFVDDAVEGGAKAVAASRIGSPVLNGLSIAGGGIGIAFGHVVVCVLT